MVSGYSYAIAKRDLGIAKQLAVQTVLVTTTLLQETKIHNFTIPKINAAILAVIEWEF